MNLKKLLTFTGAATLAVMPVATAQNPTILQGSYVSNVFGQSNFVKNPNAQTNTANVTLTTATATRSTTTPLVATSEYNVTITSANGTAAWATRTFDAGMKNQNCEARFTYRGFQATSKAQIKQGSNVVAELVLTPSATDPRIASINFPCGDLSSATTFVITDTATLAGTNEIGGIYVGLATNQANVAQAEVITKLTLDGCGAEPQTTVSGSFQNLTGGTGCSVNQIEGLGTFDTTTGTLTVPNLKPGKYVLQGLGAYAVSTAAKGNVQARWIETTSNVASGLTYRDTADLLSFVNAMNMPQASWVFTDSATRVFKPQLRFNANVSAAKLQYTAGVSAGQLTLIRFPSSSELVVTPETQNVWGSAYWTASSDWTGTSTSEIPVNYSTWGTPAVLGSASIPSSSCGLTSGDIGFCIDTLPPGTYQVDTNLQAGVTPSTSGDFCYYNITVGGSSLSDTSVSDTIVRANVAGSNAPFSNVGSGVLNVTSLQKNVKVILKYRKLASATQCIIRSDASPTGYKARPTITIKPLDNNANSALYVQGPVKASGTGTTIPSGYVGEKITLVDVSARLQNTPTLGTFYAPGSLQITVPPGVWSVCYHGLVSLNQTRSNNNLAAIESRLRNITDGSTLIYNGTWPTYDQNTTYILGYGGHVGGCRTVSQDTTKVYQFEVRTRTLSGTPTFTTGYVGIRGDYGQTLIEATRIN